MQNEREFLIEQILARMEEDDAVESHHPDCTLLMASALEQTPLEKEREVDAHCAECEECRSRRTLYREFVAEFNAPEPAVKGSLLELLADRRPFVPKRPPTPWDSRLDDLHNAVPVGYTGLAQSRESWPDLARALRVLWLPYFLELVGLDTSHTEAMLKYIEQRIPIGPDQRLSALLPGWLVDFARSINPAHKVVAPLVIDRPLVVQIARRKVLEQVAEDETPEQRRFREAARAQASTSLDDLLRFAPEGQELSRGVLEYRSYLYSRGEELVAGGVQVLQVA